MTRPSLQRSDQIEEQPRAASAPESYDPQETQSLLFRDLRSGPNGLSAREALRRLISSGPNELSRQGGSPVAAPPEKGNKDPDFRHRRLMH